MRRFPLILTTLAITGLLASACDSPTASDDPTITPPSFAGATVTTVPWTGSGTIPCTGEYVELFGEWQTIYQALTDGSGKPHQTWTWNIHGTGTGSFGNNYRYSHTSAERVNGPYYTPVTRTTADQVTVVSKGGAPNFILHLTIHWTFNNNGVMTADIFKRDLHCK